MKTRITVSGLVLGLVLTALATPQVKAQDDDVRGAFLTTRPKTTDKSAPPQRPGRRRQQSGNKTASASVSLTVQPGATTAKATTSITTTPTRMGLGLTLFMRDAHGMAVRTDPARDFHKGDHVRVLLESNADGYLYIFNTTDGGKPVMIYPDPELDQAGNFIKGHVPFEIPSSMGAEERLRWFTFDQNSGAERLYFVFTREPIAGVPMEDDLITYCREKSGNCPWRPSDAVWEQIRKELNEPTRIAKSKTVGTTETSAEKQGATRGIGLNRDDPEPSLILLTTSANKDVVVATLELNHRAEVGTP